MKNYEKYKDEIKNCKDDTFCNEFIKPHILGRDSCSGLGCSKCCMLQMIWLLEEYEEPEVDWSKVEVDTPILVRDNEDEKWLKRHFAKYENGRVYVWTLERTSWTTLDDKCVMDWNYAKLAESGE